MTNKLLLLALMFSTAAWRFKIQKEPATRPRKKAGQRRFLLLQTCSCPIADQSALTQEANKMRGNGDWIHQKNLIFFVAIRVKPGKQNIFCGLTDLSRASSSRSCYIFLWLTDLSRGRRKIKQSPKHFLGRERLQAARCKER